MRSAMASTEKCAMVHREETGEGMQALPPTISGTQGKSLNPLLTCERGRDLLSHRAVGITVGSCKVLS